MTGASFDSSEVRRLAADLSSAGRTIAPAVRGAVGKGALNIKNQMVAEMSSSTHFKPAARSISYEIKGNASYSEAQIGPERGRGAAPLAGIAYPEAPSGYFGGSRGGGTVPDPQLALEAEMPNFERFVNAAIDGSL